MLASVLISAVSVILLVYWFRYVCVLLLRRTLESAQTVSEGFGYTDVRSRVAVAPDLDPLRQAIERDYRMLTYLIEHAGGSNDQSLEDRLLMLDYRLMQGWYSLTRTAAPQQARRALTEMAEVVACLARKMVPQASAQSQG